MFKDLKQNETKFSFLCSERPYNTNLRESEQLKTTSALYNQDTVQTDEPTRYTRLKIKAQRYLDQVTKDRNFDDRNDKAANEATIRRSSEDISKNEERKSQYFRQLLDQRKVLQGRTMQFQT